MALGWDRALAWRMRRHLLEPATAESAEDVVSRLVAVVAKSAPLAELAVALRRRDPVPGELAAALAAGRVVKTYAFRGATHLMTPEQAAVHLALRTASRMWELPSWQEYYGLAPEDWPELRDVVRQALAGGPLTREELADAVAPRYPRLREPIVSGNDTLLKPLAWQGVLCFGPVRDGRSTLAALETNPRWPGLRDLDDAGPRALRSYLHAYGPARADRLQYWLGEGLGVPRRRLRAWLAALEDVTTVDVDGEAHLVLRADEEDLGTSTATGAVRLLPGHDQWVLGPGTADPRVVPPARRAVVTRGANVVVAGGVVAGTWRAGDDGVTVRWFPEAGAPPHDLLEEQAVRVAALLGRPQRVSVRVADD